jgi:transposase
MGSDLEQHIFQVHCADGDGSPMFSCRVGRSEVLTFISKKRSCLVGIEAACGT